MAGIDALAASIAALNVARAAWRASLVVAAALADSNTVLADAIFAFAVVIAAWRAARAAWNCALAAWNAAFCSAGNATFFSTGVDAAAAKETEVPAKDIENDAATTAAVLITLFMFPPTIP